MWGCAENNDTKKTDFKVKYNGKIKNSQKWPIILWNIGFHNKPKYSWRLTFKHNLIWPSMK